MFGFIPEYFVVSDAILFYGISFFNFFSDNSLLVYGNTADFCMLILYPATLLSLLIRSDSFLVVSLILSIYKITLCRNRDSFTSVQF